MLKYFIKVVVRFFLRLFFVLPIDKKKIYFESYQGKQISCNPYYIYKAFVKKYPDYKIVWCYNHQPPKEMLEQGIVFVKSMSLQWIVEELTSICLISNMNFRSFIPYRKTQILINTWHGGGAYKKTDMDDNSQVRDYNVRKIQEYASKCLTAFLSSSKVLSQNKYTSKGIPMTKFLPVGMPRNDIFFDNKLKEEIRINVRKSLNLSEDTFVMLYAPTFRGKVQKGSFDNFLDSKCVKNAIEKRFLKNAKILFRGHHYIKNLSQGCSFDLDVSAYPNMQELLCCVDGLITDYSSSMWDFSFTGKPCFLFTPDLDNYMKQRGFFTDPYSWGFPIAKTNLELSEAILSFNSEEFNEKMMKHHDVLGSYENGHATEKTIEFLMRKLGEVSKI